jgi:3-hydroxyacyl-CoA dehydrogenase
MIRPLLQNTVVLALVVSLFAPAALAQSQQQAPQQQQQPGPDVEVTDDEVDQVADVLISIEEVQAKYQQQLRDAEDRETAQSIQQEMSDEIDQTIESHDDLSVDRYDEIIRAAQRDTELKEQIMARVNEKREDTQEQGDR